jgi:tRNA (guanine37-N1)-methyltransferase
MQCEILTLFPEIISGVASQSILKRAQEMGHLRLRMHNIRDYTTDPHRVADDVPYGGGGGMVMKAEPIFHAIDSLRETGETFRFVLPSPQGIPFTQSLAEELSQEPQTLVFICGHYEGIDERVRSGLAAEEISIGDYVLTGGELATLVIIDAAVRFIPGVLGDPQSAQQDSFADSLLDYPHFTRPSAVRGVSVPNILLSGNHQAIQRWRRKEALRNTLLKRPDLLDDRNLADEDQRLIHEILEESPSASCEPKAGRSLS